VATQQINNFKKFKKTVDKQFKPCYSNKALEKRTTSKQKTFENNIQNEIFCKKETI